MGQINIRVFKRFQFDIKRIESWLFFMPFFREINFFWVLEIQHILFPMEHKVQILADSSPNALVLAFCQQFVPIIDAPHIFYKNINLMRGLLLPGNKDVFTNFHLILIDDKLFIDKKLHAVTRINDTNPFLIRIPFRFCTIEQITNILAQLLHFHRIQALDWLRYIF